MHDLRKLIVVIHSEGRISIINWFGFLLTFVSVVNEFFLYNVCIFFAGNPLVLKSVTMSAGENNRGSSSNQESQSKTQGTYVIL